MAITVDWVNKIIHVPQADLTHISGTLYELDTDALRLALKSLEAGEGIVYPDTHRHNTTVTVAGVTFARVIEIINGYKVEFEDLAYSVRLAGSNNNLFDVEGGILVQNQVQVIPGNSAGLVVVTTGGSGDYPTPAEVATAVWSENVTTYEQPGSAGQALDEATHPPGAKPGDAMTLTAEERLAVASAVLGADVETSATVIEAMRLMLAALGGKVSGAATDTITFRDLGDTKDRIVADVDADGNRLTVVTDLT